MSEDEFLAEVIGIARSLGLTVFHSGDSRRDTGKGYPDLTVVGRQCVAFIELKVGANELSTEQRQWRYKLLAANQSYYLWRPNDLIFGDIEAVLRHL